MRRHHPASVWRAGFTLIEIMVVLVLVGIVSAVIIPEMRGTYEDALLKSTARTLLGSFQLAHSRAVTLNQPHRVRLLPAQGRFAIEGRERGGEAAYLQVKDVAGTSGELDKRIKIEILPSSRSAADAPTADQKAPSLQPPETAESQGVTFFPDGTAQAVDVRLRDRAGFHLALRVNPITSRVQVLDKDNE